MSLFTQLKSTLAPFDADTKFCVALSGGVDSVVLLNLMAQLRENNSLRAVHVHHGLNPAADSWQIFCENLCRQLNIEFCSIKIKIDVASGESIEAQAREKRYMALENNLKTNEILLTAHHQDDQVETFFLQLMRGAGIKGLSAMPLVKKFANGQLVRPLLTCSRAQLIQYAQDHQLNWIEDDSNQNIKFERNFLRQQIVPLLKKNWPQLNTVVTRSSQHCATAQTLLEEYLQQDYTICLVGNNQLDITKLTAFSLLRQYALLRYWLAQQNTLLPSAKQLDDLYRTVILAARDAQPEFCYGNVMVRRFQNKLFLAKQTQPSEMPKTEILQQAYTQGLSREFETELLSVRYYQGGEKIRLPGRMFRHRLKKLWQEWNVPVWQRGTIPLIYYKDELVMVLGYSAGSGTGFGAGPDHLNK